MVLVCRTINYNNFQFKPYVLYLHHHWLASVHPKFSSTTATTMISSSFLLVLVLLLNVLTYTAAVPVVEEGATPAMGRQRRWNGGSSCLTCWGDVSGRGGGPCMTSDDCSSSEGLACLCHRGSCIHSVCLHIPAIAAIPSPAAAQFAMYFDPVDWPDW